MDILLLILLSATLLYRLWSVLGTKTDIERTRSLDIAEDNIIVLPKKQEDITDKNEGLLKYEKDRLVKIFEKNPEFDALEFKENAENAYSLILKAFTAEDKERLSKFLTQETLIVFEKTIDNLKDQHISQEIEIVDFIQTEIDKADVYENKEGELFLSISLLFKTKQIIVAYSDMGEIIDNPAKISSIQEDLWTFERKLESKDPTWRLSKTKKINVM